MSQLTDQEKKMLEKIPDIEKDVALIRQEMSINHKAQCQKWDDTIRPLVETVKAHDIDIRGLKEDNNRRAKFNEGWKWPFSIAMFVLCIDIILRAVGL